MSFFFTAGSFAFASQESSLKRSEGRAPGTGLTLKSSQVPTYGLIRKIQKIPLLDMGTESKLQYTPIPITPANTPASNFSKSPAPLHKITQVPLRNLPKTLLPAKPFQRIIGENLKNLPALPEVTQIASPELPNIPLRPSPIYPFDEKDMKIMTGLKFLEKHREYALSMGLFSEVSTEKSKKEIARFLYGRSAAGLNLNSEFRNAMLETAKTTKNEKLAFASLDLLAKEAHRLEVSDLKEMDPLFEKYDLDPTHYPEYELIRAKYYLDLGNLTEANASTLYIKEGTPQHQEGQALGALINYRKGEVDNAILDLENLLKQLKSDDPLYSLVAVTLARSYFQKARWLQSYDAYLKVKKESPFWLQAIVEQAWAQIMSKDYEGAAGNMFSLHTDFFKNAYAPESYIVRAVSYLNLCQYGDAMNVINQMGGKYSFLKERLESYQKEKKSLNVYETIKLWGQNPNLREVDKLPRSFIVEIAGHPAFTKIQKQINHYEDEIQQFHEVSLKLVQMEKDWGTQRQELKLRLEKESKNKPQNEAEIRRLKEDLDLIQTKLELAKRARTSISPVRKTAVERIEKEKTILKKKAAQVLTQRFEAISQDLTQLLEETEVLQYEIFSGAGEHLRYQVAGGESNKEERPELKGDPKKSFKWKFKGEIWEDEIGHYRSSLKNVCPANEK